MGPMLNQYLAFMDFQYAVITGVGLFLCFLLLAWRHRGAPRGIPVCLGSWVLGVLFAAVTIIALMKHVDYVLVPNPRPIAPAGMFEDPLVPLRKE